MPRAVEVLEQGGLVVLPTETVYGIAARADDEQALERLSLAKGRPPAMAWTWHVASPAALNAIEHVSACVTRLAARYWPGPLTLVLPSTAKGLEHLARAGWTGIRCTAGEFSRALCEAAPFPLVMTSANPHGASNVLGPGEWDALALSSNDLVLEAGELNLPGASSVLKIGRGHFELLREGLHDLEALRRTAGLAIGFACTGNTCRSPMAEGLARDAIARRLGCKPGSIDKFGFEVLSMGVHAAIGSPAAAHAVDTLQSRDIDITGHTSTQATPERIRELDAVYCLTLGHLEALRQLLPPKMSSRLHMLDPEGRDIADPIGGDDRVYRACAERIADCIERRLDDWA